MRKPHELPKSNLPAGGQAPREEFVILYKKFALPLMKFLVKRLHGNTEAAEEIFSQTILATWKSFHTFKHKSQFFTWVCRIALNKMADYYRGQIDHKSHLVAPTFEILANIPSRGISIEEKLSLEELRCTVKQCLEALPEEQRNVLYLRFWKEMTLKNIANLLGISEKAAEGRIYRAKIALRSLIIEKYPSIYNP